MDPRRRFAAPPCVVVKTGFTLVEILVAIAIVAILSALSLSVFSSAQAMAYNAKTLSNMRQVGMGLLLYPTDNRGYFPPVVNGPEGQVWLFAVVEGGYLNDGIATKRSDGTWDEGSSLTELYNPTTRGLFPTAYNAGGYGMNVIYGLYVPTKQIWITEPSMTILLGDGNLHSPPDAFDWGLFDPPWAPGILPNTLSGGAAHYLFADGHVEKIAAQDPTQTNSFPQGLGTNVLIQPRR
jgi:prepilin-type N-terminal cleavage/methylation domain-containing protein/prepilin-type processing-associated H-X9-DG protein